MVPKPIIKPIIRKTVDSLNAVTKNTAVAPKRPPAKAPTTGAKSIANIMIINNSINYDEY